MTTDLHPENLAELLDDLSVMSGDVGFFPSDEQQKTLEDYNKACLCLDAWPDSYCRVRLSQVALALTSDLAYIGYLITPEYYNESIGIPHPHTVEIIRRGGADEWERNQKEWELRQRGEYTPPPNTKKTRVVVVSPAEGSAPPQKMLASYGFKFFVTHYSNMVTVLRGETKTLVHRETSLQYSADGQKRRTCKTILRLHCVQAWDYEPAWSPDALAYSGQEEPTVVCPLIESGTEIYGGMRLLNDYR